MVFMWLSPWAQHLRGVRGEQGSSQLPFAPPMWKDPQPCLPARSPCSGYTARPGSRDPGPAPASAVSSLRVSFPPLPDSSSGTKGLGGDVEGSCQPCHLLLQNPSASRCFPSCTAGARAWPCAPRWGPYRLLRSPGTCPVSPAQPHQLPLAGWWEAGRKRGCRKGASPSLYAEASANPKFPGWDFPQETAQQ